MARVTPTVPLVLTVAAGWQVGGRQVAPLQAHQPRGTTQGSGTQPLPRKRPGLEPGQAGAGGLGLVQTPACVLDVSFTNHFDELVAYFCKSVSASAFDIFILSCGGGCSNRYLY